MLSLKTIDKYLLQVILRHLFSVTILIVSIVWLSQSLRFLELIVNNNIGIKSYILLIVFLLPDLFAILLPICLLISGAHIFQKLIADHEMTVLRSTGYSNLQIAKPFLIICSLATAIVLYSNIYFIPESFQKFRSYERAIRDHLSSSVIQPKSFNFVKGVTVYVKNRSVSGELKGVFIHSEGSELQNSYSIAAEKGYLKRENDQIHLVLVKGIRHEWDRSTKKLSYCGFDSFLYDLTELTKGQKQYHMKPYEHGLKDLLNPEFVGDNKNLRNRMISEAHQRLLMPWLCIINGFVLMSILLYGDFMRRQRKRKILTAVSTCIFFQIALISMINGAANNPFLLPLAYGFVIGGILFFFGLLVFPQKMFFKKGHVRCL